MNPVTMHIIPQQVDIQPSGFLNTNWTQTNFTCKYCLNLHYWFTLNDEGYWFDYEMIKRKYEQYQEPRRCCSCGKLLGRK